MANLRLVDLNVACRAYVFQTTGNAESSTADKQNVFIDKFAQKRSLFFLAAVSEIFF